MRQRKCIKRISSISLALCFLLSFFPVALSAQSDYLDYSTSKIVREVTELREESVKHFLCEDGSYIAATYASPVHYEENGEWKEIDNSLVLTSKTLNSSSKYSYEPKASAVSVNIPRSFSEGQKITVENKGYTVSFGLKQNEKNVFLSKTADVVNVDMLPSNTKVHKAELQKDTVVPQSINTASRSSQESKAVQEYNADKMAVGNQAGAIVYEDIFQNADLEYIVTSGSIKENIVVYKPQKEYVFRFDIDLDGLTPVPQENGSIRLVEEGNSEESVFILETPYMYDAENSDSYDVTMSLEENGDTYLLTLEADAEWLNNSEREFPVVIDPTFTFSNSAFDDMYVINGLGAGSQWRNNELRVGRNLTNLARTYIKMALPTNIPAGSVVTYASMTLKQASYFQSLSQSDVSIKVYDCDHISNLSFSDITWNHQPFNNANNGYNNSGATLLDNVQASDDKSSYTFDITEAVQRWLCETDDNRYLMLASSNESSKTQIDLRSSRVSNSSNRPTMWFYYGGDVTIIYDGNGNTSGDVPQSQIVITPGNSVVSQPSTMEKEHFIFGGWKIEGDSGALPLGKSIGDIIYPNESISWNNLAGGKLKLKAVWLYPTATDNLFTGNSDTYNHDLATFSMYLSAVAYNPLPDVTLGNIPAGFMTIFDNIRDVLYDNGFLDIEEYYYESSGTPINTAAHTIAHKDITLSDGSTKTLIAVTVRGTAALIEWLTDLGALFNNPNYGFIAAKNDVLSHFEEYVFDYGSSMQQNRIVLITGHSLGAAVANLLAADLNESPVWGTEKVYSYTFATPYSDRDISTDYDNIFNIINRNDIVPYLPPSFRPVSNPSGRHGKDIPITMEVDSQSVSNNHKMDTYLEWMRSQSSTLDYNGIMNISESNVSMRLLPRLLNFKCPVEVTLYDDEWNVIGYENQEENAVYPQLSDTGITSWITDSGEKVFFIPYGSNAAKVVVEAYDYGMMNFSAATIDINEEQPCEIITFNNVNLYPGKEFMVDVSENVEVEDTQLFITENGEIVGEVTVLNPLLKSVFVDNLEVNYGTPSVITVVTHKTVTKVQFIDRSNEMTLTYDRNNAAVISLVEDGDNLIWTIQRVFRQGDIVFDVAVKVGDVWTRTEKVFELIVV